MVEARVAAFQDCLVNLIPEHAGAGVAISEPKLQYVQQVAQRD